MQPIYTIITQTGSDGPHDLVSIMRKIRAGKIKHDTLLIINQEDSPQPASAIPEIKIFFESSAASNNTKSRKHLRLNDLLGNAWQFVGQNSAVTVFAGALVAICVSLLLVLSVMIPSTLTYGIVWLVFVVLHNIYMLWLINEFRGQQFSSQFVPRYLLPSLIRLIVASLLLALMITGGLIALLIPGMMVAVLYVFVPFLIADKRYRVVEAMLASRLLIQKAGKKNVITIAALVGLHFLCLLLIIPIPLTLPLFSVMLSEIYEDLVSA